MDNLKYPGMSSKRQIKHGPTPLAPSPSPSNAAGIATLLRQKYIFGDTAMQVGRNKSAT